MKEKVSCKHCSSAFDDNTILKDYMTNEHSVSCTVCHMKFKCNKMFKEHKQILHIENSADIENTMNCKYCEFTCFDEGVLKKHTTTDH